MNNPKSLNQEIFSAVSLCNYPPNVTDYLIRSIVQIMNYPHVKSKPQYKIKTINNEKIIAIRIPLDIPFHKNNYDVPIVIFFPVLIPLEPPKVFIEVSKHSAINPKVKDIEIKTRRITTPLIRTWEQNTNFINILNEIKNSFSNTFPIYKVKKNNNANNSNNSSNTININNNAVFNIMNNNINNNINNKDPFENIASIFTDNFLSNVNNNNVNNNIIKNNNNFMDNININFNNNKNNNNIIIEKRNVIKNILVEEVFDKISSKLISEYKKLNQQNKTLNNYKNQFRNENEKMEKYFAKRKEIENKCIKDLYHLNTEIKNYSEKNKKKEINKITPENCLNYIKIESPEVIKSIANEINLEELIIIIRKGFEKKAISFEQAIKSIRETSRDIFRNKINTEKKLRNIGKFY